MPQTQSARLSNGRPVFVVDSWFSSLSSLQISLLVLVIYYEDCIFRLPQMPFTWEFTPLVKKLAEKCVEIDGVVVF